MTFDGVTEDDIAGLQFLYGPPAQVSKTDIDDFDGHKLTGALISSGETLPGNIEFTADEDWFRVLLTPGQTYLFDLVPGTDETPLTELALELKYFAYDWILVSADSFLANTSKDSAKIAFTPNFSGIYWVVVKGGPEATGSYQLSVTDLMPFDKDLAVSEGESDFPA